MDPTETIVPLDEIADVMLNNLLEAQLSINNDEDEDLRLFEEIVFSNQARTYAELDQKSSKRVVEFFNKSDQRKYIDTNHREVEKINPKTFQPSKLNARIVWMFFHQQNSMLMFARKMKITNQFQWRLHVR